MSERKSPRIIVAASRRHADTTAVIDWGWRRGMEGWIDHEGHPVRYASSADNLRGLARGTIIYRGCGWYENKALGDLDLEARIYSYRLVEHSPVTP